MNKDHRILCATLEQKLKNLACFMNFKYTLADAISYKIKLFMEREYKLNLDFDIYTQSNKHIIVNTKALKECSVEKLIEIYNAIICRPYITQTNIGLFKKLLIEYRKFMLKKINLAMYRQNHSISDTSFDMFIRDEYMKNKEELDPYFPTKFTSFVFAYLRNNNFNNKTTFNVNVGCPFFYIPNEELQEAIDILKLKIANYKYIINHYVMNNTNEKIEKVIKFIYENIPWYLPLPDVHINPTNSSLIWENNINKVSITISERYITIDTNESVWQQAYIVDENNILSSFIRDHTNNECGKFTQEQILEKIIDSLQVFNWIQNDSSEF
jgi:hypothetical protein